MTFRNWICPIHFEEIVHQYSAVKFALRKILSIFKKQSTTWLRNFLILNRIKSQIDLLMETPANQFSNSDIMLTYNPSVCINAGRCARELSDVFRTSVIPWVDLEGAPSEKIIEQVKRCPSGALRFKLNQKVA